MSRHHWMIFFAGFMASLAIVGVLSMAGILIMPLFADVKP